MRVLSFVQLKCKLFRATRTKLLNFCCANWSSCLIFSHSQLFMIFSLCSLSFFYIRGFFAPGHWKIDENRGFSIKSLCVVSSNKEQAPRTIIILHSIVKFEGGVEDRIINVQKFVLYLILERPRMEPDKRNLLNSS